MEELLNTINSQKILPCLQYKVDLIHNLQVISPQSKVIQQLIVVKLKVNLFQEKLSHFFYHHHFCHYSISQHKLPKIPQSKSAKWQKYDENTIFSKKIRHLSQQLKELKALWPFNKQMLHTKPKQRTWGYTPRHQKTQE